MIGGVIIEIVPVNPGMMWVNTGGVREDYRETCAVLIDPKDHNIKLGDFLWWQKGTAHWTPRDSQDVIKIKKLGLSGATRPRKEVL